MSAPYTQPEIHSSVSSLSNCQNMPIEKGKHGVIVSFDLYKRKRIIVSFCSEFCRKKILEKKRNET